MAVRKTNLKEDIWDVYNNLIVGAGITTEVLAEFPDTLPTYPVIIMSIPDNSLDRLTFKNGYQKSPYSLLITVYDKNNLTVTQISDQIVNLVNTSSQFLLTENLSRTMIASSPTTTMTRFDEKIHLCNIAVTGDVFI